MEKEENIFDDDDELDYQIDSFFFGLFLTVIIACEFY